MPKKEEVQEYTDGFVDNVTGTYNQLTFRSLTNRPQVDTVPVGKPIYEWVYLDASGEECKERRNVQEQIQSFERQTAYKERIKQGEEINDNPGIYMDVTKLGDSFDCLSAYVANTVKNLQQGVKGEELESKSTENSVTNQQTEQQSTENQDQRTEEGGNE